MIELAITLFILLILMAFSFWQPNSITYMLSGGISCILGLQWYDCYTSKMGLTVALMLLANWLLMWGLAYRTLFWRETPEDAE